jgi:fatty acid desaturase
MYVPCYNLPRLHALLMQKPQAARMEVQSGYLDVLRLATALSDAEDRPGAIVSNARRIRDGARIGEDQASAGF